MSQIADEKSGKVRTFLEAYQSALRGFFSKLPNDGFILPKSIVNAIGRCEVWPCTDAAVVLTYLSKKEESEVLLHKQTGQSVELFMRQSDVFSYFDENGEQGSMRLSFAFPNKDPADRRPSSNDFLFDRSSLDDLIAWPPAEGADDLGLSQRFFAPKFTRISIFGWNAYLGSPTTEALKDLRKGYAAQNLSISPPFTKGFLEALFESGAKSATQLEKAIDHTNHEVLRQFIIGHPEVVRPDYLRAYSNVTVGDRAVDLVLLIPGERSPEYLFLTLGGPRDSYFTEANDASDSYSKAESALAKIKDVTSGPHTVGVSGDFATSSFLHVSSRTALLNYAQKKSLYERGHESNCRFETYDDLLNRFRYCISDVTGVRDRFLSIESRLSRLGVASDENFDHLMQQVDREMQTEQIPLTARAIEGVLRFSSVYSLYLLNSDPLCKKVNDWFDRWYGDRGKITMGLGSMGVMLRGDVLRMDFPIGFGLNRVICTKELTKDRPSIVLGTSENPPTLNALDFVQGLTQEFANTLSQEELQGIFYQFVFGRTAFMRIFEVFERSDLTRQARADFMASSSHLFESHPNYALSKWASLQASEKFIKDFIIRKGGTPPRSHNLKQLATIAEQYGLAPIPGQWLDDIECSAEVRYGGITVTSQEAVEAQHAALQVCEHIAPH